MPPIRAASISVLSAVLLAGCFMPAAQANRVGNRWEDARRGEVEAQMENARRVAGERGWRMIGQHRGWISEQYNPSDEPRFTLPSSGTYTMVAFCDANCDDIDLAVLNSERRRIAADLQPDDTPVVEFTGQGGQNVLGRVTIPGCKVERCAYGVMLLGR